MSGSNKDDTMDVEIAPNNSSAMDRSCVMDTTEPDKNIVASATSGSVTCSLHPLVIMNVSEHWTRSRAQNGNTTRGEISLKH